MSSDYVSFPSNAAEMPSAFTVVFNIKPKSWPANGAAMGIVSKANLGVSSSWLFRLGSPLGAAQPGDAVSAWAATTLTESYGNSNRVDGGRYSNPPIDSISQVAIVYSGGFTIYVNTNPLYLTSTGTPPATALTTSTATFDVGGINTSGTRASFADCEVSDVRIYSSALTETQLATIATTGELAGYGFRARFATSLNDSGPSALTGTAGGAAKLGSTSHGLVGSIVKVGVLSHSNGRGKETLSGDTEASRGGSRRYAANKLASVRVFWRGVGNNPSLGGWSNYHDCVDASTLTQIRSRVSALMALGPGLVWVWGGINDARAGVPMDTSRTQLRGIMSDIFAASSTCIVGVQKESARVEGQPAIETEALEGLRCFAENVLMDEQIAAGKQQQIFFNDPSFNATTDVQADGLHVSDAAHQRNGELFANNYLQGTRIPSTSPAHTQQTAYKSALGASLRFLIDGREKPVTESGVYAMRVADLSGNGFDVYAGNNNTLNAMEWTGAGYNARKGINDFQYDWMETSGSTTSHTSGSGAAFGCLFRLYDTTQNGTANGGLLAAWVHGSAHACAVYVHELTQTIRFYFDYGVSSGYYLMSVPYTKALTLSSVRLSWNGGALGSTSSYDAKVNGQSVTVSLVSSGAGSDNTSTSIVIGAYSAGSLFQLNGCIRRLSLANVLDSNKVIALDTYLAAGIGAYDL